MCPHSDGVSSAVSRTTGEGSGDSFTDWKHWYTPVRIDGFGFDRYQRSDNGGEHHQIVRAQQARRHEDGMLAPTCASSSLVLESLLDWKRQSLYKTMETSCSRLSD